MLPHQVHRCICFIAEQHSDAGPGQSREEKKTKRHLSEGVLYLAWHLPSIRPAFNDGKFSPGGSVTVCG
jgi:hypothetical protein